MRKYKVSSLKLMQTLLLIYTSDGNNCDLFRVSDHLANKADIYSALLLFLASETLNAPLCK